MSGPGDKRVSIRWNGKEISDPAELPPDVRKLLEDADGDGIPDLAQRGQLPLGPESAGLGEGNLEISVVETSSFEVNGKSYARIEDLPPELREATRAALAAELAPMPDSPRPAVERAQPLDPARWLPMSADRPAPAGPSWLLLVVAALAGALLMYLLLRA